MTRGRYQAKRSPARVFRVAAAIAAGACALGLVVLALVI